MLSKCNACLFVVVQVVVVVVMMQCTLATCYCIRTYLSLHTGRGSSSERLSKIEANFFVTHTYVEWDSITRMLSRCTLSIE